MEKRAFLKHMKTKKTKQKTWGVTLLSLKTYRNFLQACSLVLAPTSQERMHHVV